MSRVAVTRAAAALRGTVHVPGDKSISHRRALFSLFTDADVHLDHFNSGADCETTLVCLEKLGKMVRRENRNVAISGTAGFPPGELDCGNSGTTARLLMGILAGRIGEWTVTGDASLSRRPMERVAEPLRQMGAQIELTDGRLPARIVGRSSRGIEYSSPIASAQVKSAVLLAAMQATGVTRYREPLLTRDHTEKILGLERVANGWITADPKNVRITAESLSATIPGDPSAAAFWIAAALLVPKSLLTIPALLLNPTRISFLDLLRNVGAQISIDNVREESGELSGDVSVRHSPMRCFSVDKRAAALCMDEVPVLTILATRAQGVSAFDGIGELRAKESDRLQLITGNLRRMGASVSMSGDRLSVTGDAKLHGAEVETSGDHRLAMSFAVAGLAAHGRTTIHDAECVRISYPEFWSELERIANGSVIRET